MAGARNTEAASLDTTIGNLVTEYATYAAVAVTGEKSNAPANYMLRSLINRLSANADLKQAMIQMGFNFQHHKPLGIAEKSAQTLVILDPNAGA